jgi:ElaB/YqjD/DUF883 family membrane-anchored ribosome-binding protein
MKRQTMMAALFVCLPSGAWCQAPDALPDGSNYPDPQCTKPQVTMVRPIAGLNLGVEGRTSVDNGPVGSYNSKVKQFNHDAIAYDACMHAYIDKANGDVKRIQDKANADMKQISERANAAMKVIQDKARQAVSEANSVTAALDQQTAKIRRP